MLWYYTNTYTAVRGISHIKILLYGQVELVLTADASSNAGMTALQPDICTTNTSRPTIVIYYYFIYIYICIKSCKGHANGAEYLVSAKLSTEYTALESAPSAIICFATLPEGLQIFSKFRRVAYEHLRIVVVRNTRQIRDYGVLSEQK